MEPFGLGAYPRWSHTMCVVESTVVLFGGACVEEILGDDRWCECLNHDCFLLDLSEFLRHSYQTALKHSRSPSGRAKASCIHTL